MRIGDNIFSWRKRSKAKIYFQNFHFRLFKNGLVGAEISQGALSKRIKLLELK